jgi:hypothetical protein
MQEIFTLVGTLALMCSLILVFVVEMNGQCFYSMMVSNHRNTHSSVQRITSPELSLADATFLFFLS